MSKKCSLPGNGKSASIAYVKEIKGKTALFIPKSLSTGKAVLKGF